MTDYKIQINIFAIIFSTNYIILINKNEEKHLFLRKNKRFSLELNFKGNVSATNLFGWKLIDNTLNDTIS